MGLKKNGLYILDIEYPLEMETETRIVKDKVFGIVRDRENCYFKGMVIDDGDTMIMTKEECERWVKSAREVTDY